MREAAERARRAYESAGDRLGAWRAGLYEAISYGSFGFTDEARRRVDEPPPEPLGIDDRAFLAMTRTYQTFDEGRLDVLGQRYGEVIDALESSTNIPLWYHCVPRSMQCGMPGMDGPLARFAAGALRVLPDMPTPLRALALALRGWEELSAGKVAVAAASVELADSDARWLGPPPNVRVFVYALLPILHALHGRAAEARSALDELMKTFDDPDVGYRPGSFVHVYYSLHRVRIADLLGDVESARALLAAGARRSAAAERDDAPRPRQPPRRRDRAPRRPRRPRRRGDRRLRRGPRRRRCAQRLWPDDRGAAAPRARAPRPRARRRRGRVGRAGPGRERSRGPARRRRADARRDPPARAGRRRLAGAAPRRGDRPAALMGDAAPGDGAQRRHARPGSRAAASARSHRPPPRRRRSARASSKCCATSPPATATS